MQKKGHFRSARRPSLSHQVTIRRPEANDQKEISALTKDISTGGMFVVTDAPFELGEQLTISLATPSTWEPLSLLAEVCRTAANEDGEAGIGLKFVGLTDAQLVALIDLTDSLDFES